MADLEQLKTLIQPLLDKGQKVQAIKMVRKQTGWGLRQAKEFVDTAVNENKIVSPAPPPGTSAMVIMVQDLVRRNRKIEAVKYVRQQMGWGLKQAKEFVDTAVNVNQMVSPSPPPGTSTMELTVQDLLRRNRVIEAIKYVREQTGWGLKQAKDYVDQFR